MTPPDVISGPIQVVAAKPGLTSASLTAQAQQLGVLEIAKTTEAERFCRDALALHARLFRLWHRFRAGPGIRYGPITREQLIAKSIPLEKKFFALADRYADSVAVPQTSNPGPCRPPSSGPSFRRTPINRHIEWRCVAFHKPTPAPAAGRRACDGE
jgi:hypothetical protein